MHWKQEEVDERAARLEAEGYEVDGDVPGTSIGVRELREDPPTAFVIDLDRLPSHGREVAFALRQSKALRAIPIVFVGGVGEKVERIRSELPDAAFTSWEQIGAELRRAIEHPPLEPLVPQSDSGPRSGRSLAQKLGIKEGMTIAAIDAPAGVERMLAPLPARVTLRRDNRGGREMTLWFLTARAATATRT